MNKHFFLCSDNFYSLSFVVFLWSYDSSTVLHWICFSFISYVLYSLFSYKPIKESSVLHSKPPFLLHYYSQSIPTRRPFFTVHFLGEWNYVWQKVMRNVEFQTYDVDWVQPWTDQQHFHNEMWMSLPASPCVLIPMVYMGFFQPYSSWVTNPYLLIETLTHK